MTSERSHISPSTAAANPSLQRAWSCRHRRPTRLRRRNRTRLTERRPWRCDAREIRARARSQRLTRTTTDGDQGGMTNAERDELRHLPGEEEYVMAVADVVVEVEVAIRCPAIACTRAGPETPSAPGSASGGEVLTVTARCSNGRRCRDERRCPDERRCSSGSANSSHASWSGGAARKVWCGDIPPRSTSRAVLTHPPGAVVREGIVPRHKSSLYAAWRRLNTKSRRRSSYSSPIFSQSQGAPDAVTHDEVWPHPYLGAPASSANASGNSGHTRNPMSPSA